jgi:hypothetical protein
VIEYKARTKAGRAWIAAILDATTRITKVEIDNLTDERTEHAEPFPVALMRDFIEIDGRDAVLYDLGSNLFVYFCPSPGGRYVVKYVIRTYAFDVSDLPEMEKTKP